MSLVTLQLNSFLSRNILTFFSFKTPHYRHLDQSNIQFIKKKVAIIHSKCKQLIKNTIFIIQSIQYNDR